MRATEEIAGIKAYGIGGIETIVEEIGLPRFRAGQLIQWLYGKGARSFDEMTNLPIALRDNLAGRFDVSFPEVVERRFSEDGTRKYLVEFQDGAQAEIVGIPSKDRLSVCVSSQVGCAMGCSFCATGMEGLGRNLGPGEIADQVRIVAEDFGERVSNAVVMGQGEPFMNYDATLEAMRIMNHPDAFNIGARHITVSTCGVLPGIRRFATEPEQFTLAISLHSAIQKTRDRLMPGVKAYTLDRLRDSVISYAESTHRRPTFEYALIAGVNDTDEEMEALADFTEGILAHVNIIPLNPVSKSRLKPSTMERAEDFARALGRRGTEVTVRKSRGSDIEAACGQLKQVVRGEES